MKIPVLNLELVREAYYEGPEPPPKNIRKMGRRPSKRYRDFKLREQVEGFALAYVEQMNRRPTPGA